jgi:protein-S-isoprenylcysteine O-methyltransferase Ste14
MVRWRQLFKTERDDRILYTTISIVSLGSLAATAWDFIALQQGVYSLRWLSLVGFMLFIPGLVIYLAARMTLGRLFSKTLVIVEGHELITHGIYRHVRHPSYTGSILFFLGLPLLFNSVLGFAIVLPMILLVLLRIPIEENMLLREFGKDYREYMKRTKKLIPSVY